MGKKLDGGAGGIVERDRVGNLRRHVGPAIAFNAMLAELLLRVREVECRIDLKRQVCAPPLGAGLENNRFLAHLRAEDYPVAIARRERQPDDVKTVLDEPVDIRRFEGRMSNLPHGYHG